MKTTVVDQYGVRESCARVQTAGFPYAIFEVGVIGCLDAPEFLPLGAVRGWASEYLKGSRVISSLGRPR